MNYIQLKRFIFEKTDEHEYFFTVSQHSSLRFMVKKLFMITVTTEGDYESIPSFDKKPRPSYSTLTLRKKGKCKSAWDLISNFRLTLSKLSKLNLDPKKASEVSISNENNCPSN